MFGSKTLVALSLLIACAPSVPPFQQEAVVSTVYLPSPNKENPVDMGDSLSAHPDFQALAVAAIASVTQGRVPGVRFLVVHNPAWDPVRNIPCESFRVPGRRAYIVLSWWESSGDSATGQNQFTIGNIQHEVDYLAMAEDDVGGHVTADPPRSNFGDEFERFFGLGGN